MVVEKTLRYGSEYLIWSRMELIKYSLQMSNSFIHLFYLVLININTFIYNGSKIRS